MHLKSWIRSGREGAGRAGSVLSSFESSGREGIASRQPGELGRTNAKPPEISWDVALALAQVVSHPSTPKSKNHPLPPALQGGISPGPASLHPTARVGEALGLFSSCSRKRQEICLSYLLGYLLGALNWRSLP